MNEEELARKMEYFVSHPVRVTLTDNTRRMVSMKQGSDGVVEVRMHHMFAEADDETLTAVGRFVGSGGVRGRKTIGKYVDANEEKIREKKRRINLRPRGEHFDLEPLRDQVCERYFPESEPPNITWGRTTRGKNRYSIQFASFDAEKHLVRMNPKLDAPFVPEFFLRYLIYHEILHHRYPPQPGDVHTEEYREALQQHPDHGRAKRWEKDNLYRFVRSASKPKCSG